MPSTSLKEDIFTKKAYLYANKLILEEVQYQNTRSPLTIIDLACSMGSSIFNLQKHFLGSYYCITINPTQVVIATQNAGQGLLQDSVQFIAANFTTVPEYSTY